MKDKLLNKECIIIAASWVWYEAVFFLDQQFIQGVLLRIQNYNLATINYKNFESTFLFISPIPFPNEIYML